LSADLLPVKKAMLQGHAGLGVDIGMAKSGWLLSPEIRYTAGFSDIKDNASTSPNSLALSSLKKNAFTLNITLRKR